MVEFFTRFEVQIRNTIRKNDKFNKIVEKALWGESDLAARNELRIENR